ncbi:MAG: putative Flp pilus assembly protein TadB [Proteobacteria bacterium]|nr:putative Flp pilus assembly protein TadB [Pseudomonadota bacterium]
MTKGLILAGFAGALMFCAGLLLLMIERRVSRSKSVAQRLDAEIRPNQAVHRAHYPVALEWGYRMLQRSGLVRHPRHLVTAGLISAMICTVALLLRGIPGLLVTLSSLCAGVYLFVLWRAAATHNKMQQQLPGFIDLIIRSMGVGRSFDSALLQAIEDSPAPLSEALETVKREHSLGGSLVEALQDTAEIYRIKELHMLTLALRINQRYGGSIKAMLENINTMIRQREQADRELRALTGETRVSAWLLGTMPIAMAGYMMAVNPNYIGYLVDDPNGTKIIATAVGLQVAGGLLLWRMMRSIR